jgi:peroxin-5
MSFLGGAECSTAGNPLSQFSKLGSDDKSLQRDRLVGRGPANLQGMRSNGLGMSGSQDVVSSDTPFLCLFWWKGIGLWCGKGADEK